MMTTSTIRVLLADDHPLVMKGFAMALADYGIAVIGQAVSPDEAYLMHEELKPDVTILDIRFAKSETGLDVARKILKNHVDAKIMFLSQFDQDNLIKEAYRIGGYAFITKNCDPELLATAVRRAHEGEKFFMPEVAERLARLSIEGDTSPQSQLTDREIEIFTLMAKGLTNQEIADQLNLSAKTISNTSQAIKEKLGIHRAADITRLAVKFALLEP